MLRNLMQFMELMAFLYCLSGLYGEKMKYGIHTIVLIISDLFLMAGINDYGFPAYLVSLFHIVLFLYCLFYYKKSIKLTLINCFLSAVIIGLIQLILYYPVRYLELMKNEETGALIVNTGCLIAVICLYRYIKLKRASEFLVSMSNWLLVFVLFFILLCFGVNMYQINAKGYIDGKDYIQFIYFSLIFFTLLYQWQAASREAERKRTQIEMNQLYFHSYEELISLVRERQHDMMNHIDALFGMLYSANDFEELVKMQKEYCNFIVARNKESKLLLTIENPLIAGFLYKKKQETEMEGIELHYRAVYPKSGAVVPEYELIEISGILLDNAIEACEGQEQKEIFMELNADNKVLHLSVSNSSRYFTMAELQLFFQQGYSSKGKMRGIGLKKLKKMVSERGGELRVFNEEKEGKNFLRFEIIFGKDGGEE